MGGVSAPTTRSLTSTCVSTGTLARVCVSVYVCVHAPMYMCLCAHARMPAPVLVRVRVNECGVCLGYAWAYRHKSLFGTVPLKIRRAHNVHVNKLNVLPPNPHTWEMRSRSNSYCGRQVSDLCCLLQFTSCYSNVHDSYLGIQRS